MATNTPRSPTPATAKSKASPHHVARKADASAGKRAGKKAMPEEKPAGILKGKAAIITGGESDIGRAMALLFAREGADVAIVYSRDDDGDAEVTRAFVEREGQRCITLAGDVRDPYFCLSAVKQTVAAFGRLDLLVNNAPHVGLPHHH